MNFEINDVINWLQSTSDQNIDIISKKAAQFKSERYLKVIHTLEDNFKAAWFALEKEGVEICFEGEVIRFDEIEFDD